MSKVMVRDRQNGTGQAVPSDRRYVHGHLQENRLTIWSLIPSAIMSRQMANGSPRYANVWWTGWVSDLYPTFAHVKPFL